MIMPPIRILNIQELTNVSINVISLYIIQVMLLGRLHHRNLVNLVGYCAERGEHMLVYVYMSKGSLASHLYSKLTVSS